MARKAATLSLALVILACGSAPGQPVHEVPGGDPVRAAEAFRVRGCVSCHTIPGIRLANATVGPPLTDFADRMYIAGTLLNTTDNLLTWILTPQAVEPGTAMPNMGMTEQEARDMTAYLYTLTRHGEPRTRSSSVPSHTHASGGASATSRDAVAVGQRGITLTDPSHPPHR
ncbi:MAG: c-type cytochrome [Anaerolineae bacterium]|nr:c-type cytochrome [Anaerolineae bacterium]